MCVCQMTTNHVCVCFAGNMGFGAKPSFGQQQNQVSWFMQLSPCFVMSLSLSQVDIKLMLLMTIV